MTNVSFDLVQPEVKMSFYMPIYCAYKMTLYIYCAYTMSLYMHTKCAYTMIFFQMRHLLYAFASKKPVPMENCSYY